MNPDITYQMCVIMTIWTPLLVFHWKAYDLKCVSPHMKNSYDSFRWKEGGNTVYSNTASKNADAIDCWVLSHPLTQIWCN